jgi:formate dehydrogenase beta subunit
LLHDFDAVFVAVGAHTGLKLPIPGNDRPGVLVATDFLREVSLADSDNRAAPDPRSRVANRRILVLGGGNVAIDAAMSAVRLGASWVGMACLESREKMPAHDWEVQDAQAEGIEVFPSRTFKEITHAAGHVTGVRMVDVIFRGFVEGRPDFDEISDTEQVIPCDAVIFAIGQKPDLTPLIATTGSAVATLRGRTVAVAQDTLATNIPGLFAGGDAVTGTTFVVDAIAAGHKAAKAIRVYLGQKNAWPPPVETVERLTAAELGEVQARCIMAANSPA